MSDDLDLPPAKKPKIEIGTENAQDSQAESQEKGVQEAQSYGLHVTPEEVEQLREFQVLDEVNEEEDSNDDGSDKTSSDELPEEEIEKMLEEDLPEDFKGAPKPRERKYVKRKKIVLEEKGINYFEVLPLDWMMVRHSSGMPIYMHRASRVCTLSKPYFLGKGNTRRHDIPISAIPCLAYRIALKEEQKQMEIDKQIAEQIKNGTWADPKASENAILKNGENPAPKVNNAAMVDLAQNDDSQNSDVFSQNSESQNEIGLMSDATSQKSECQSNNAQNTDMISQKCEFQNGNDLNSDVISQPSDCWSDNAQNSDVASLKTEEQNDNGQSCDAISQKSESSDSKLDNKLKCPFSKLLSQSKGEDSSPTSTLNENSQDSEIIDTDNVAVAGAEQGSGAGEGAGQGPGARPVVLPGGRVMAPPRVETLSTSWKARQLSPDELNNYCKKLFKFKEVLIMHFKRWADRRKYTKARKTMQYPTLPEGTKLITIPAHDNGAENGGGKTAKRDWVMNMNGCSYLSVFHEYVRRALHKQPVYEFKQLENATAPYQATVYIGGMQYGVGRGSSKRQAKSQAARASIHILIPEMRDQLPPAEPPPAAPEPDFSFFDYVSIEDPRIQEFCGAAAEPSPHAILRTCLLRNIGAGDRHIHTEMKKLEFQKIELTMKVGKHSATVVCKNKKQAKQRASQAILQQLHPHIRSWGSLLRLYGSRSVKSCKERKLEEQQITLLQDKARHNEPNHAVLEKLRNEMGKLKERDNAVVPIGTLVLCAGLPTHSGSNLNNVDL